MSLMSQREEKGIRGGDAASASHSCGRHSRHPLRKPLRVFRTFVLRPKVLLRFAPQTLPYMVRLRRPIPGAHSPSGAEEKNPTLPLILPKSKLEITKQKDALYFGIFWFFSESATLTQFHYYK